MNFSELLEAHDLGGKYKELDATFFKGVRETSSTVRSTGKDSESPGTGLTQFFFTRDTPAIARVFLNICLTGFPEELMGFCPEKDEGFFPGFLVSSVADALRKRATAEKSSLLVIDEFLEELGLFLSAMNHDDRIDAVKSILFFTKTHSSATEFFRDKECLNWDNSPLYWNLGVDIGVAIEEYLRTSFSLEVDTVIALLEGRIQETLLDNVNSFFEEKGEENPYLTRGKDLLDSVLNGLKEYRNPSSFWIFTNRTSVHRLEEAKRDRDSKRKEMEEVIRKALEEGPKDGESIDEFLSRSTGEIQQALPSLSIKILEGSMDDDGEPSLEVLSESPGKVLH